MPAADPASDAGTVPIALDEVLGGMIRDALREAPEIASLALGDHQGLPIIDATTGLTPVMTFTAMATMALRTSETLAKAVGLGAPRHLLVESPQGTIVVVGVHGSDVAVIALLRPRAHMAHTLGVLHRLRDRIASVV